MELLLIRHALPVRVVVESGRADPGLTETGRAQAAAVSAWLADEGVTAIYSSPLVRARETAAPLAAECALPVVIDDAIVEWDRDSPMYIPMEELKATDHEVWQAMAAGRWDDLGLDVDGFRTRVVGGIDAIAARHPGGRVAVVCHGGVINVYAGAVLGVDDLLFFEPDYTSITRVLVSRSGTRSIRSLNETAHLRSLEPAPGR